MPNIKQSPKKIAKTPTEVRIVKFDFTNTDDLASAEVFTGLNGTPSVTPNDLDFTVASGLVSGQYIQVTLSAGASEQAFTASASTDFLTATAHGYDDGYTVNVAEDGAENLPTGLAVTTTYYVVNKTADTFQLSKTSGGDAIDLTADGQGTVFIEYHVFASGDTDLGQTVDCELICFVRT